MSSPHARRLVAGFAVLAMLGVAGCSGGSGTAMDTSTSAPTPAPTATPTPEPTSTTTPAGLAAPPGLGLKWNWSQRQTLPYVDSAPDGPTFYEVEWCEMEPQRGQIDYAPVDSIVRRSTNLGHPMMLKIRVGAGCWGAKGSGVAVRDPLENTRKTPSGFPTDTAGYEAFVQAFVTHYTALGVDTYAIENEVDAANFWSGTPQEYVRLVSLGAKAVRAANPAAKVLDAGISSTGYGVAMAGDLLAAGKDKEALALYQRYYARRAAGDASRFPGAASVGELREVLGQERIAKVREMVKANWTAVKEAGVTAYQLHFYEGAALAPVLLDYIREHLPADVPVQGWEVGLAWPGKDFTLDGQAAEVARLLAVLYARGVTPLVYLPLAFTPGAGKKEVFRGIISPDGSALPAAGAFEQVASAVKASRTVEPLRAQGFEGAVFVGESTSTAVVWRSSGSSGPLAAAQGLEVKGLDGRSVPAGTTVGPAPVFLDLADSDPAALAATLTASLGTPATLG